MISIIEILAILLIHWIADFCLQNNYMALNKSHSNHALFLHTLVYSIGVFFGIAILYAAMYGSGANALWFALKFSIITLIIHSITDYYTSRLNAKLWPLWINESNRLFFTAIGGDQLLHYAQLFITYKLLKP